ncbi:MAG: hypothetical protein N2651_07950, partial [Fimbriimonadales bacterium]|nr:hypothetical protein [Fimbriimonadales bacterium]
MDTNLPAHLIRVGMPPQDHFPKKQHAYFKVVLLRSSLTQHVHHRLVEGKLVQSPPVRDYLFSEHEHRTTFRIATLHKPYCTCLLYTS